MAKPLKIQSALKSVRKPLGRLKDVKYRYFIPNAQYSASGVHKTFLEIISEISKNSDIDNSVLWIPNASSSKYFVHRVVYHPVEEIFTFHFVRVKSESDQIIANLKTKEFVKLREKIDINQDQGPMSQVVCAFCPKLNIIAWQSALAPLLEDFGKYLENKFPPTFYFKPLVQLDAKQTFDEMKIISWSLEVAIPKENELIGLSNISGEEKISLAEQFALEANATYLNIEIGNDSKENNSQLNKALISQLSERFVKLANFRTKPTKMTAKGRVSINGRFDTRVVDLIKGLLIHEGQVSVGKDVENDWLSYESTAKTAIEYARNIQTKGKP